MTTTHRYFDLIEFTKTLNETHIAAVIAQGTAWRIDSLIVSKSRSLLREVREHMVETDALGSMHEAARVLRDSRDNVLSSNIDVHTAMADAVRGAYASDDWFRKAGIDRNVVTELAQLAGLRDVAHADAAELTAYNLDYSGRPRVHKIPELEEFFMAKQEVKLRGDVVQKALISSKALAEAEGVDFQELHERRLKMKLIRAQELAENTASTADLAWWMFEQALRSAPSALEAWKRGESVVAPSGNSVENNMEYGVKERGVTEASTTSINFNQLPVPTQLVLIQHAIASTQRALSYAEDDKRLTDAEFARILACAMKTEKQLRAVMAAPKFAQTV